MLSITENCETLIEQTHWKPHETIKFMFTQPRESFSLKLSNNLGKDSEWMTGLTSLEAYNFVFNITEENNKHEFYTDFVDEFSFTISEDELEEIFGVSDISSEQLQDKIKGRVILNQIEN